MHVQSVGICRKTPFETSRGKAFFFFFKKEERKDRFSSPSPARFIVRPLISSMTVVLEDYQHVHDDNDHDNERVVSLSHGPFFGRDPPCTGWLLLPGGIAAIAALL